MFSILVTLVAAGFPLADALDNVALEAHEATPRLLHDQSTTPYCSFWYHHDGSMSCAHVLGIFGVSLADFTRWNPSITAACGNFLASNSYCVEAASEPLPTNNPEPGAAASASTSTSILSSPTKPTKPTNGIETPSPTQPDLVDNCKKFYWVQRGDQCAEIAQKNAITLRDFLAWNPKAGKSCAVLWADAYACVGVLPAFHLKTRHHADCTGPVSHDVSVEADEGVCVNTGCAAASLEVAADGLCPDGQVQIGYWEQPDCSGNWFGYQYADRGKCHGLWTEGRKFRSLHLRCARQEDDCVSRITCTHRAEPVGNVC